MPIPSDGGRNSGIAMSGSSTVREFVRPVVGRERVMLLYAACDGTRNQAVLREYLNAPPRCSRYRRLMREMQASPRPGSGTKTTISARKCSGCSVTVSASQMKR